MKATGHPTAGSSEVLRRVWAFPSAARRRYRAAQTELDASAVRYAEPVVPGESWDRGSVWLGKDLLIRPDLRGFGESDKRTGGDYSADGQVRSVLGLLDELKIEHAVHFGYDVGSRVAQLLATRHPQRVSAMVLAPPLPGIGRRVLEPDAVQEFWYQSFHRLGLADELVDGRLEAVRAHLRHFWNHWSGPGFEVSADRLDHLAARYSAPGAFTASIGWYRAGAATVVRSLAETAPKRRIVAPTTVLWPEHDPLFPRAWADRAGEWFADIEVSSLPGVGHFVPVEAPVAFAEAIRQALAR